MAPLLKLLLHVPLLLGVSLAHEPQNRPSLTDATSTPVPLATGGILNMILGSGAFPKMLSPWDGRNLTEGDLVESRSKRARSNQLVPTTVIPPFSPTICPPKTFPNLFGTNTRLPESKTHHRGICTNTCMRQYLTPVVSTVSGYNASDCKQVTKVVTYSESPHWGDAHGKLIPKALVYSLAGLNPTATNKPPHCKERQLKTRWKPSRPTSSISKKGKKKDTRPPKVECTSFESCYLRCEKTTSEERKVMFALILILGGFALGVIAFIIGRKLFRTRHFLRRTDPSRELGPVVIHERPVEEVVEVVTVEPMPEEQTVEKKGPAVIVEEPTPTTPRSTTADGASDSVDERDAGARLRVPRATGSDLHDSESGAKLRV